MYILNFIILYFTFIFGEITYEIEKTFTKEACHNSLFKASCPSDQMIMVSSAHHGRMRNTKCTKSDIGFLGCYNDVTGHVHRICSGRQSCSLRMPNSLMDRFQAPCNEEFINYLQVNFSCVRVKVPLNGCLVTLNKPDESVFILHSNPKAPCMWRLKVKKEQRIGIELYDFSLLNGLLSNKTTTRKSLRKQIKQISPQLNFHNFISPLSSSRCIVPVANIYEKEPNKEDDEASENSSLSFFMPRGPPHYSLCGSDLTNLNMALDAQLHKKGPIDLIVTWVQAYETSGNEMVLELLDKKWPQAVYVIKIAATGCPKFPTDEKLAVVIQLHQNLFKVECLRSEEIFYATCFGNFWNGSIDQCNKNFTLDNLKREIKTHKLWIRIGPNVLALVVILIFVFISIAGLCYCRRRHLLSQKLNDEIFLKDLKTFTSHETLYGTNNQKSHTLPSSFLASNQKSENNKQADQASIASPSLSNAFNLGNKRSMLATKTRPSTSNQSTKVWDPSDNSSRSSLQENVSIATFYPQVNEALDNQKNLFKQNMNQINPTPIYRNCPKDPGSVQHQPQMLGLRTLLIDKIVHDGKLTSYRNAILNETYFLPSKQMNNVIENKLYQSNLNTNNMSPRRHVNEYENDDHGYIEQRRLPQIPQAFPNASYNNWTYQNNLNGGNSQENLSPDQDQNQNNKTVNIIEEDEKD